MIIFPQRFKDEVRFFESPTVAVALTVSYIIFKISVSVTAARNTVEKNIMINDIHTTATALLTACFDIVLLNKDTSSLPFMVQNADTTSTAIVTVFTPPAVPTGEPPINIRSIATTEVAFVRFSCGRVAKPAVRVVTD